MLRTLSVRADSMQRDAGLSTGNILLYTEYSDVYFD